MMAIMHAEPHTERRTPAPRRHSQAAEDEDLIAKLEELQATLDLGPGHKIELLEGRLVVSSGPVIWHGQVVIWLGVRFHEVSAARGWTLAPGSCIELPPTRERIEPDFEIFQALDKGNLANVSAPKDVLLVCEIVSPNPLR